MIEMCFQPRYIIITFQMLYLGHNLSIFLSHRKIMFRSQEIHFFYFLVSHDI